MRKYFFILISISILFISCNNVETYNDAETFDLKGFSKIENLKGKTL